MLPLPPRRTSPRFSGLPDLLPRRHHPLPLSPEFGLGITAPFRRKIVRALLGLPTLLGSPISFEVRSHLTAYRGQLLSNASKGTPVHAGAFIRQRLVVLSTELFFRAGQLRLILAHEVFHFVWVRLSNALRESFAQLLIHELQSRARGEAGESAGIKKALLSLQIPDARRSPLWRDYVCESFCDSAATFATGIRNEHFTLATCWVHYRYSWLLHVGQQGWRC